MKIKITSAKYDTYWYADRIGEIFESDKLDKLFGYRILPENMGTEEPAYILAGYIDEGDAEIIDGDVDAKIIALFYKMDTINVLLECDRYWKVKVELVCAITEKYGPAIYKPETIHAIYIPAALLSTIVNMERKNLGL